MEKIFVDYEISKMLKELGFDLGITDVSKAYDKNGDEVNWTTKHFYCWKPLWQQVEEWLWDKHKIYIETTAIGGDEFEMGIYKQPEGTVLNIEEDYFNSPITAKMGGIKQAVKYLHAQKK